MKLFGLNIGRDNSIDKGQIDRVHLESVVGSANAYGSTGSTMANALLTAQTGEVTARIAADIYTKSPYVYAATKLIASQLSSVPLRVYTKNADGHKKEKTTGYPYIILDWVNPQMTRYQLLEHTISWLILNGNAWWSIEETVEDLKGKSQFSIYPLNPKFCYPVPSAEYGEAGVIYQVSSDKIFIPNSKLVHFKTFSSNDYWHGQTGLNALRTDIEIERFAKKQQANFFSQAAVISGVLTVPQDIDDEEILKLKREFYAQYGGARNAYRVMVLKGGMEYDAYRANMGDFHTVPILEQNLEIHAIVMGVPVPLLTGHSDKGQKLVEAEALMWKKTIMPLGMLIEQTITKHLVPDNKTNMVVEFDYTDVEALRLLDLDRMRVEVAGVITGIYKPNEVRLGRDMVAWDGESAEFGDMATPVYLAQQAASTAQAKASASLSLPGSQGGRDQSANGEAQMADTTAQRSVTDDSGDYLNKFMHDFLNDSKLS